MTDASDTEEKVHIVRLPEDKQNPEGMIESMITSLLDMEKQAELPMQKASFKLQRLVLPLCVEARADLRARFEDAPIKTLELMSTLCVAIMSNIVLANVRHGFELELAKKIAMVFAEHILDTAAMFEKQRSPGDDAEE